MRNTVYLVLIRCVLVSFAGCLTLFSYLHDIFCMKCAMMIDVLHVFCTSHIIVTSVLKHACSCTGASVQTNLNTLYKFWVWVRILSWVLPAAIFPFVDWLPHFICTRFCATPRSRSPSRVWKGFDSWVTFYLCVSSSFLDFFFVFAPPLTAHSFLRTPLFSASFLELWMNVFFSAIYALQFCDSLLLSLYLRSQKSW